MAEQTDRQIERWTVTRADENIVDQEQIRCPQKVTIALGVNQVHVPANEGKGILESYF